jgi:hypothetical protein
MSEPGALQWLESLRSVGAWRLDPTRFRYLEALSRRLPSQTEPVRRLLQDKLQVALADYARRFAQAQQVQGIRTLAEKAELPADCASPRAELNQYIHAALPTCAVAEPDEKHEFNELASVRRFRRAWSSYHIHDKVEQAASRMPANAGPLNSHLLVLRSLAMLGELSDDYLRRFLVQVESLQWLDQASEKYSRRQAKPTRRSRPKK